MNLAEKIINEKRKQCRRWEKGRWWPSCRQYNVPSHQRQVSEGVFSPCCYETLQPELLPLVVQKGTSECSHLVYFTRVVKLLHIVTSIYFFILIVKLLHHVTCLFISLLFVHCCIIPHKFPHCWMNKGLFYFI